MSQELYAFVDALPHRAQWQAAIDQLAIDLQLDPTLDVATDRGFQPCTLRGQPCGFELSVWPTAAVLADRPSLATAVGTRPRVIAFRWGADLAECASALAATLALVRTCAAIAYSPDDATPYDTASLERDLHDCLTEL
jgi:hypothetical protein